jgi:hypothetical protein
LFRPAPATDLKETPMKLSLNAPKPRNPFVAAALRRSAGHGGLRGSQRQAERNDVRRELRTEPDRLHRSP